LVDAVAEDDGLLLLLLMLLLLLLLTFDSAPKRLVCTRTLGTRVQGDMAAESAGAAVRMHEPAFRMSR
jgi:Tfp pilus assembly protein PilX